MFKSIFIFLVLLQVRQINAQDNISYHCSKLGTKKVNLDITKSDKALNYQNQKIFIYQYLFLVGSDTLGKYYLYTFNQKTYILDGSVKRLDHLKDQLFFSPTQQICRALNLNGILRGASLIFERNLSINNLELYYFDVRYAEQPKHQLTKVIFDNSNMPSEWQIKSGKDKCQCTRNNIIVRLK